MKIHKMWKVLLFSTGIMLIIVLFGCSAKSNIAKMVSKEQEMSLTNTSDSKLDTQNDKNVVPDNDLLYRKYNIGSEASPGTVLISKEAVHQATDMPEAIVIFYNDRILKTLPFKEEDLNIDLKKGGYYCFLVLDSEKKLTDISEKVTSYESGRDSIVTPLG